MRQKFTIVLLFLFCGSMAVTASENLKYASESESVSITLRQDDFAKTNGICLASGTNYLASIHNRNQVAVKAADVTTGISSPSGPEINLTCDAINNKLCAGTSVTFTATPSGTSATNFQWKKNGSIISGATGSTYTASDLVNGDAITAQLSDHSGAVVTSNLVMHLDAGNPLSYPGTGSTWTDLSGNNNNATLPSTLASSYSSVIGGGSFNFQGNSSTTIQSSAMNNWNVTTTNALSVETWINRVNYGNYHFWFSTPDLYYRLGVNPGGNLFWDMAHYVDRGGVLVSEKVWHHIVYTAGIESGKITTRVYVDGSLVATQNEGVNALSAFTNYLIGDGQTPGQHPLNGNMGLMRVYNKTLSASEVTQNYNAEVDRFTNGILLSNTITMTVDAKPTPTIHASGTKTFCDGGSVTLSTFGGGNAIEFNGSNKITFASVPTIPAGNSTYTIEAWVKPNSVSGANGIVGWGNWGQTNHVNALRFNGPNQLINYWWDVDLGVNIPNALDGKWHHVAATYNGTTRSIYWDGVLKGSDTPTGHNVTNAGNMNIACTNNGEYFDGQMDEVRIWNVGRSQAQIQANMNKTIPVNSAGLAAYYRFDEGSGTIAADATGNGNTGTLNNSPTWELPSTCPFGSYNSYLWSTGATTADITVDASDTYSVTVEDSKGCSGTASSAVTVYPLPVPVISGATSAISGQTGCVYTTEAGMTNYSWSVVGGTATAGGGYEDNTITVTWNTSGMGHVKVNYTNGNACSAASQTDYTVPVYSKTTVRAGGWNDAATWSPTGVPTGTDDLKILHAVVVDNTPTAICNNLSISSASVTVNSGQALTVSGILTNTVGNSGLVINSGGSLLNNTGGVAATVKRDITDASDDKWHLFISPINSAVAATAGSCFSGAYVDRFNEPTAEWVRLLTDENVTPGIGYSINFLQGTHPLVFAGTLTSSPVEYSNLSFSPGGSGYSDGWNLIGNPYPCAIKTELCSLTGGLNAFAYVWNGLAGNYTAMSIGANDAFKSVIASMQGFFVRATTVTNSLTLANASKTHGGSFLKSSTTAEMLKLAINGNSYRDETYVRFLAMATSGFDQQFDAYKLSGNSAAPQLYSIVPGEKAAVNTLPSAEASEPVLLGLKVGASATYSLTVSGIESLDPSLPVRLNDLKLGTSRDLRINPTYSFTAQPGDVENRFALDFATVTGLYKPVADRINIRAAQHKIFITPATTVSGKVYLYSASGQLVSQKAIDAGETMLTVKSSGVYVVKVVTANRVTTGKVVVE